MQYVFIIEDGKVKDAYEFHVEKGIMLRKEEWTGITAEELEEYASVRKLREMGYEIVYEVR